MAKNKVWTEALKLSQSRMESPFLDYAIISVNNNPAYTGLWEFVKRRWNQLGVKAILIKIHETPCPGKREFSTPKVDADGNIRCYLNMGDSDAKKYKVLHRYFYITICRWMMASFLAEYNPTLRLVISDIDLYPINKMAIFRPTIALPPVHKILEDHGNAIVATNLYPHGEVAAAYQYGYADTFRTLLGVKSMRELMDNAKDWAWKTARMYATEEHYINHLLDSHALVYQIKMKNRKMIEQSTEMNTLYPYMINRLTKPVDLAPFIELHNMRAQVNGIPYTDDCQLITEDMMRRMDILVQEFDGLNVPPPNYYYDLIDNPWRDTMITKDGHLVLGDEFDDNNN